MKAELAMITTVYMKELVESAIAGLSDEMDVCIYIYSDFNEVLDIYNSIPQRVRGIVVSGPNPEHIILSARANDGRVVRAFMSDTAGIFKNFIQIFHEYPGLTTDRIFFDSFHLIGINLDEYLYGKEIISWEEYAEGYFRGKTTKDLIASENEVYQTHLKLWRANRIDVSLTRFSSLVEPLRKAGVNVRFLYPTEEHIQTICREVAAQVQIEKMRENQPGVILVTARGYPGGGKALSQTSTSRLGRHLRTYVRNHDAEAIIAPAAFGFEILSNRQTVEKATAGWQECRVRGYLSDRLDFPVSIGYGLGLTLAQARLNAVDAVHEAVQHPGQSYLINDQDELVGPLQAGKPLVVSRKAPPLIREVSVKTGLSTLTVQRVLSVMEKAEEGYITSQMLAQKLSITQRSANRFLQALLANGQAEIIGVRRATTKGRPERLYRLLIGGKDIG